MEYKKVSCVRIKGWNFFEKYPSFVESGEDIIFTTSTGQELPFTNDMKYLIGKTVKVIGSDSALNSFIVEGDWVIPWECIDKGDEEEPYSMNEKEISGWSESHLADANQKEKGSAFDVQVGGNHYQNGGMQPAFLAESVEMRFGMGNILKYNHRHKNKNGKQDLVKILHYIQIFKEVHKLNCDNPDFWYTRTPKNESLFREYILTNTQFDFNQIAVVLCIMGCDIEGIEKFIKQEIEDCYGEYEDKGEAQSGSGAEKEADKDAGRG